MPKSQIASTSPAAGRCEAALPPGPVAFTGTILTYEPAKDVPRISEFYRTIVRLTTVQVEVREAGREYKFKYVPGEVAEVVLLHDRWPVAEPGDCVLVVGDVRRWACGAACDAAGFVASRFELVTGE